MNELIYSLLYIQRERSTDNRHRKEIAKSPTEGSYVECEEETKHKLQYRMHGHQ